MILNHKLLIDANILKFSIQIDIELANKAKEKKCPYCKNVLHFSRYLRKGCLLNEPLPEEWFQFHSLCCSSETCRKRTRPPSVRYAGRSPHGIAVLLLVKLIHSGGSQRSIISLTKEFKVSERTVRRWLSIWNIIYSNSNYWKILTSKFMMNGKELIDIWKSLLIIKNIHDPFQYIIEICAEIWNENQLFVGGKVPAKDA